MAHNISKFESQFKYIIGNINEHVSGIYEVEQSNKKDFKFVNNYDFYKEMNII